MITMVTKQTAQQIVDTVQDICGHDINFINQHGIIFASTNETRIGTFHEIGKKTADTRMTIEVSEDNYFEGSSRGVNIPVSHNGSLIAVIGISGDPKEVRRYAHLAEKITRLLIREQELNAASRTQAEKKTFLIRALLNENPEYPDEIFNALKEFYMNNETKKRALFIQIHSPMDTAAISCLEPKIYQMFEQISVPLFCYQYPNAYTAIAEDETFLKNSAHLEAFAQEHKEILSIGVGHADSIYRLKTSFHSCRIALDSLSLSRKSYALFDDLTLEIILSSIGKENRNVFLNKTISSLSPEDTSLLFTYFEENQSLSRTCDKLFLHKNTLQYRLDRIHRSCGLNPREFKDAVILYLALKLHKS